MCATTTLRGTASAPQTSTSPDGSTTVVCTYTGVPGPGNTPLAGQLGGGEFTLTVPDRVTSLTIDEATGGRGGNGAGVGAGAGGSAGRVSGSLTVAPGQTLNLRVAAPGQTSDGAPAQGGFNGGGGTGFGGAGGGATTICDGTCTQGPNTYLLAASGGGGAGIGPNGGGSGNGPGGSGATVANVGSSGGGFGSSGGNGGTGTSFSSLATNVGGAGGAPSANTAGGGGGAGELLVFPAGAPGNGGGGGGGNSPGGGGQLNGSVGQPGQGAAASPGGGGGGGFFGGGSGASNGVLGDTASGGGAGSSYIRNPVGATATTAAVTADPVIRLTYTIPAAPLVVPWAASPLPTGTVGNAYSAVVVTGPTTGGTPPVTYTASGTLPPGLALSPVGQLTGTPTAAGTYSFTVTATDSANPAQSVSHAFSVTINPSGGGGGSILPINLNGVFNVFNNIAINNNVKSPGSTNVVGDIN
ncbi:putative Ig domain-containing protein [Streptomyces sp. NBC_00096]|uniref:putative Ig domain-containing protein n=1 Tax=Streptomyces sp. NBC_00096 TaxID=2975650 RepID=UPI00325555E1